MGIGCKLYFIVAVGIHYIKIKVTVGGKSDVLPVGRPRGVNMGERIRSGNLSIGQTHQIIARL